MRVFRSHFLFGLAVGVVAVWLAPESWAYADYIFPGEVNIKTADYRTERKSVRYSPGTYHYGVTWQGVPVGSAVVTVYERETNGSRMLYVEAKAKTTSAIDVFYRMRHTSQSVFYADPLRPASFYSEQVVNSKSKVRHVIFRPGGEIVTRAWKNGKEDETFVFRSDNLTLDPITAAFLARSVSPTKGRTVSFDVFNGKHRYLIDLSVLGREVIRIGGRKQEVLKVKPVVKKLTDTEGEKRLKRAFLWVTTDGSNEVVKLESEVLIGSIVAELERFDPPSSSQGTVLETLQARAPVDRTTAEALFSVR